jgi:hypothetical protein
MPRDGRLVVVIVDLSQPGISFDQLLHCSAGHIEYIPGRALHLPVAEPVVSSHEMFTDV